MEGFNQTPIQSYTGIVETIHRGKKIRKTAITNQPKENTGKTSKETQLQSRAPGLGLCKLQSLSLRPRARRQVREPPGPPVAAEKQLRWIGALGGGRVGTKSFFFFGGVIVSSPNSF